MVVGRSFEEVPYIASRICGICSASHVVTDIRAIEAVFGSWNNPRAVLYRQKEKIADDLGTAVNVQSEKTASPTAAPGLAFRPRATTS